jgi:hypothetical protein
MRYIMARENYKPKKPADLIRPREADVDSMSASFSDHAFRQPIDPRRKPEMADSRMIKEDHTKMSNLPEKAINKQWTPGKHMPHYWMESEVRPFDIIRFNESEDE